MFLRSSSTIFLWNSRVDIMLSFWKIQTPPLTPILCLWAVLCSLGFGAHGSLFKVASSILWFIGHSIPTVLEPSLFQSFFFGFISKFLESWFFLIREVRRRKIFRIQMRRGKQIAPSGFLCWMIWYSWSVSSVFRPLHYFLCFCENHLHFFKVCKVASFYF